MAKNTKQQSCTPCKKTSIGGQALMEGIMMRGPQKTAMAVRNPEGEIVLEVSNNSTKTPVIAKIPVVRGVYNFAMSMIQGYKCLMRSAEISGLEEAEEEMRGFYHGECVAIGMLVTSSAEVRERLVRVLKRLGRPTEYNGDLDKALSFISHDKKCEGEGVSVIFVDTPGSFRIEKMTTEAFCELVRERI